MCTHICTYIYIYIYIHTCIQIVVARALPHRCRVTVRCTPRPVHSPRSLGLQKPPIYIYSLYIVYIICVCMCVYIYIYMYTSLSLYIYIYIYITNLSLSLYIYIYIHTHTKLSHCVVSATACCEQRATHARMRHAALRGGARSTRKLLFLLLFIALSMLLPFFMFLCIMIIINCMYFIMHGQSAN